VAGDGGRGAGPPDFSPLFDAIRAQLGLRVDKGGKGPVDYLVIDSVQKPAGN
jgi:uncharacterized protein (TIGR03435 family)